MTETIQFKTFQADKCRNGVRHAAWTILKRIERGFGTTTIVLPPRSGKSHLMRSVAIEAIEVGLVGAVVNLVPWTFLRCQLNDPSKVKQMQRDHGMHDAPVQPREIRFDSLSGTINPHFYRPRQTWWTMTMGQALQEHTRLILQSAATYMKAEELRPLLVFIDECHLTSSGPSGWGRIANDLREAGAHLALLTGTPERSDNIAAFGFEMEEIKREPYKGTRFTMLADDQGRVETVTGDKVMYRVKADYQVSLREAWDEKIITRIQARWFDCKIDGEDLSTSSESSAQRALSTALRNPEVVSEAITLMLEELQIRRNAPGGQDTAAIVFVGNDQEDDEVDNFECRQVKRIIEQNWSKYFAGTADVKIATMSHDSGEKAVDIIQRFIGDEQHCGVGHVIIVKQMGGVGLDSPRLKIAVDLSTIRTKSNATQRWLRVATTNGDVNYGTLILPKDPRTQKRYEEIITENGGQWTIENLNIIDTKTIELEDTPEPIEEPEISDARRAGSIDMTLESINVDDDCAVDRAYAKTPFLALRLSRREVSELIKNGTIVVPDEPVVLERPNKTIIFDTITEATNRHNIINTYCRDLATQAAGPYIKGTKNFGWINARKKYMSWAKSHADIPVEELASCHDIEKLDKAINYLQQKLHSDAEV